MIVTRTEKRICLFLSMGQVIGVVIAMRWGGGGKVFQAAPPPPL